MPLLYGNHANGMQQLEREKIFLGMRMSRSSVYGMMKAKVADLWAIFTWILIHVQENMVMRPTSLSNLDISCLTAPVDPLPLHLSATSQSQPKPNHHFSNTTK